jgi:hypothetical protein
VIDRRQQIVDRTFESLDERGRHALRAGGHAPAVSSGQPRRHFRELRVDVDQRRPLAVHGYFELLSDAGPPNRKPSALLCRSIRKT